jgi:hypothetical protein
MSPTHIMIAEARLEEAWKAGNIPAMQATMRELMFLRTAYYGKLVAN